MKQIMMHSTSLGCISTYRHLIGSTPFTEQVGRGGIVITSNGFKVDNSLTVPYNLENESDGSTEVLAASSVVIPGLKDVPIYITDVGVFSPTKKYTTVINGGIIMGDFNDFYLGVVHIRDGKMYPTVYRYEPIIDDYVISFVIEHTDHYQKILSTAMGKNGELYLLTGDDNTEYVWRLAQVTGESELIAKTTNSTSEGHETIDMSVSDDGVLYLLRKNLNTGHRYIAVVKDSII